MYPQFDYGSLYGGGFNPYQGFGGFNPYQGFGGFNPYQFYGMGSLFGGGSPYDDLFSSFQTKLDDLFKNYETQLNQNIATAAPVPSEAATTPATTETAGKQVEWNKKTSKYGSQTEKQTAYDKIMADPNATAEAKAMAEKGNVYGATQMPKTENSALSQINQIIPQSQRLSERTTQPVSFDSIDANKLAEMKQKMSKTPLKIAGQTNPYMQATGPKLRIAGDNKQINPYMPTTTSELPSLSSMNSLFGNTGVAKNPKPIQPRYR